MTALKLCFPMRPWGNSESTCSTPEFNGVFVVPERAHHIRSWIRAGKMAGIISLYHFCLYQKRMSSRARSEASRSRSRHASQSRQTPPPYPYKIEGSWLDNAPNQQILVLNDLEIFPSLKESDSMSPSTARGQTGVATELLGRNCRAPMCLGGLMVK